MLSNAKISKKVNVKLPIIRKKSKSGLNNESDSIEKSRNI